MSLTLTRLNDALGSLAAAEERVARHILDHPEEVAEGNVNSVAEAASASEATVVRVCKKVGFDGFRDFKVQLIRDLALPLAPDQQFVEASDSARMVAAKVFSAAEISLQQTLQLMEMPKLLAAAKRLAVADEVITFGVGTSAYVALDAMRRLMRIGIRSHAETSGADQAVRAALLGEKSAIIAVSLSGRSREPLRAIEAARDRGATIIAVTAAPLSPLAQCADYVFPIAAQETAFNTEAMASRLAGLAILDALLILVAMQNENRTNTSLGKIAEAVHDRPHA